MTRRSPLFPLAAVALFPLALAGCPASNPGDTGTPDDEGPGEYVTSGESRDLHPAASEADVLQVAADNRAFGLDLYHHLDAAPNLFFSPHSVSYALAMAFAGANGPTADEMAATMRFTLPEPELHVALNALDLAITSRGEELVGDGGDGLVLHTVNRAFAQDGVGFEPDYLSLLATQYGSGVGVLDFAADPEGSREAINNWVEAQTNDRILDLFPPGTISSDTVFVLVNAIYFKASWLVPFDADDTTDDAFTRLDGSTVAVPTMHGSVSEGLRYASGDGWEMVEMPYVSDDLSMVLLVPEAGRFEEIEAALDSVAFDAATDDLHEAWVDLALPKFSARTALTLVEPLVDMGMELPFTAAADFSGITTERDLFISMIVHQGFVAVDEQGTEAAAATGVAFDDSAAPDHVALTIDRPFLLAVRDRPTDEVLFFGKITDPSDTVE